MSYNRKQLKVRYEGEGTKPKKKKKNPNTADISSMGYRDDSPYRNLPYIDIHTPDGTIDMSATGIPLLANGRVLPPYSGTHQFDTDTVREIPLAQKGREMKQMLDKISRKKKLPKVPKSELILKDDLLFPTDEADVPIPYEYPVDADIYFKNLPPAQWFIDRENWRKSNPQQQPPMEAKQGGWLDKYQGGKEVLSVDPQTGLPVKNLEGVEITASKPINGKNISLWLNPMNWGVPDFTDKYKTWDEAYVAAKKQGLKEIIWNKGPSPGRKNLDYAGTVEEEAKTYFPQYSIITGIEPGDYSKIIMYESGLNQFFRNLLELPESANQWILDRFGYDHNTNQYDYWVPDLKIPHAFAADIKNKRIIDWPTGTPMERFGVDAYDDTKYYASDPSIAAEETFQNVYRDISNKNFGSYDPRNNNCADAVCEGLELPYRLIYTKPSEIPAKLKSKYPTIELTSNKTNAKEKQEILYKEGFDSGDLKIIEKYKHDRNFIMEIQGKLYSMGYEVTKYVKDPSSSEQIPIFDGIYGDEIKNAVLALTKQGSHSTPKWIGDRIQGKRSSYLVGGSKLPPHLPEAYKKGGWLKKYQTGSETGLIGPEEEPKSAVVRQIGVDAEGNPIQRPTTGYYLPTIDITAEKEDTYNNYMLDKYRDAGLGEALFMAPLDYVFGYPQAAMTKLFSGKYQLPSEAMGVENAVGAFLLDAFIDPTNVIGAGLFKNTARGITAKNLFKKGAREVVEDVGLPALTSPSFKTRTLYKAARMFRNLSEKAKDPAIKDHFLGLQLGMQDIAQGRPVFETFPLTKAQKAKVFAQQDAALEMGEDFVKDWIYNGNMDFRPSVYNKMENLGRSTGETFKFPAEHIKLDFENPLIKHRGKLIDSRRAAIRELAKNDPTIDVKTIFEKRGKAGGFISEKSGNYTYRNHGLYAIRPYRIADVAAHELSHIFQKHLGFRVNPDGKIVGKGFGRLNAIYDPSVTPYYYPNPNTMYGQLFGEYMTKPKLFSDLRDEIFQKKFGKSHDEVEKSFGDDVYKKIVEKKFGESYDDISARLFTKLDSSGNIDVSHWTQRERDLLNEASEEYSKTRKPYSDAIAEFDKKKDELWDKYYTWAASPDELHSELMVARKNMAYKLFADSGGSASWEEVLQALREPTDEVIDLMIDDQSLNRFFDKDTPQEIKRSLIKALPAFGGAGFIYGASDGQPEPEPQMYKKGGWLKKYQKGGTKEKGYYVSNTPYVEGTDYSEGRVPANYWTGSSVPKDIIYSGGTLPTITIKPEAEDENQILENTMLAGATAIAALLTKKKVNPAVIRKIRMDVKRAANTLAKPDMKVIYEPETPLQQIANKTYWTGEYLKRPGLFLEHMGLRRPGYMNMDQNNWQNYLVQTGSQPSYMRLGKQGFDPSSSGSYNEGIYYLKDYPRQVVKFDTYGYQPDELRHLLSKAEKLKMKNTALPLKAVKRSALTDWADLLIYNKLPYGNPKGIGKSKMVGIRYMTLEDLEKIPQKAWDDLGKRAEELAKNDIYIDYVGPNVVYDKVKKTFVIYDPALAAPPGQLFNSSGFIDWNYEVLKDIPYKPDAEKKVLIKKALEEMIFNPRNNAGFIHSVQQRIKPELDKDILKRKTLIGDFASQLDPFDVLELQRILKTRPPESFQLQRGHTKKIISDLQNELDALNNTSFINDKKIRLKAEDVLVDRKIIDEFRNHFDKSISKIRNIKKKGGAAGSAWLNKYQEGGEMEIVRNQEKLEPVPQEDIVKIIEKLPKKEKTDSAEDLWAYEQDVMAEKKALDNLKNAFKTPEQMLSSGEITKKQYDSVHDVEYYHDKDVVKALYDKDGNVIYHSGDYGMYKNPLADPFESAVNNLPLVEITAEKTAKQRLSDFTKAFPGYALSLMAGGPAGMMLWAAYNQAKGNIAEMNTAGGYSIPLEDFAKGAFGDSDKKLPGEPIDISVATESDAFRMYMGQDQAYSSFYPSPYQEGAYEINGYHNYFPEKFDNFPSQKTIQHENERTQNTRMGEFKPWGDMVMGRHQISSGEDERGKYIEYYDLWDLDTYKNDIDIPGTDVSIKDVPVGEMIDKTIGKPFPIRGRVYYKKDPKTGEYVREDLLKKRGGVIRKNRK